MITLLILLALIIVAMIILGMFEIVIAAIVGIVKFMVWVILLPFTILAAIVRSIFGC